jgi:FkbM family methyltransferase
VPTSVFYTLVASKLVGESDMVIALEPAARSFKGLQKNIALNNFRNVLTFPVAACNKAGSDWLYYGTDPVRNSLGKSQIGKVEGKK